MKLRVLTRLIEIQRVLVRHGLDEFVRETHLYRPLRFVFLLSPWIWFQRLSGFSFADLTSGFRYYDSKALTVLAAPEATLLDYQDIGVLLLLRAHHLSIVEIPVSMNMRQSGKSRIFSSWFAVAHYMVKTTLLCIAGRRRTQLADVT